MEIKTKQDQELEKLATTLRKNKLANSDSEAIRMAKEMLFVGRKVAEDFAEKKRQMVGDEKKDADVDLAHKQMERIATNIASGKRDVRINLEEGIDTSKPLNELMREREEVKPVQEPVQEYVKESFSEPEPELELEPEMEPELESEIEPESEPEELSEEPESVQDEMFTEEETAVEEKNEQEEEVFFQEDVPVESEPEEESSEFTESDKSSDEDDDIQIREVGEDEKPEMHESSEEQSEPEAEPEDEPAPEPQKEPEEPQEMTEEERKKKYGHMAEANVDFLKVFGRK